MPDAQIDPNSGALLFSHTPAELQARREKKKLLKRVKSIELAVRYMAEKSDAETRAIVLGLLGR